MLELYTDLYFKFFHISQIFRVNMYNFYYKRRGKENLPLTHVDRSHFMKSLMVSTTSEDTRGTSGRSNVKPFQLRNTVLQEDKVVAMYSVTQGHQLTAGHTPALPIFQHFKEGREK